jgi:hypothetical protein
MLEHCINGWREKPFFRRTVSPPNSSHSVFRGSFFIDEFFLAYKITWQNFRGLMPSSYQNVIGALHRVLSSGSTVNSNTHKRRTGIPSIPGTIFCNEPLNLLQSNALQHVKKSRNYRHNKNHSPLLQDTSNHFISLYIIIVL